jgi:DNA helicase-2/ATP-dependent DNA helicase PcrA
MSSYLDNLNYEQKQAVTADLGPILIVAGAGTGKTKTLTSRIIYLVEEMNLQPENILAITFTNKAADEMKERAHLMSNRTNGVIFGTYHSLCTRILKQEIKILGRNEDFNIIDDEDQNSLIKDIYHSLGFDFKELSTNLALKTIERIKNNEIDLATFYTYDDAKKLGLNDIHQLLLIKKIYLEYVKQMNEQNLLDFNDLLNFTRKILIEHDEIAKYYSNQFKYILVDEFQDTNIIQFEILNKLINNSNVFVVGDPDQTIYT